MVAAMQLLIPGWKLRVEEWDGAKPSVWEFGKRVDPDIWRATYSSKALGRAVSAFGSAPAEAIARAFIEWHEKEDN